MKKAVNFIKEHRTWSLLAIFSILGVLYLGYTNVWQPAEMLYDARRAAGESVNFFKDLIEFISQKDIVELLKVITPIIVPIITYKIKSRMDSDVKRSATEIKHISNKVVRDKLGIADRRKVKVTIEKNRRKNK